MRVDTRLRLVLCVAVVAMANLVRAQPSSFTVAKVPFADARAILQVLRDELVPAPLKGRTPRDLEAAWPQWVESRNATIRQRVAQGDDDSVIHLVLFGTTFTKRARPTDAELTALATRPDDGAAALRPRVNDFIAAVAAPGSDERLQVARRVVTRAGIDPSTAQGRDQMRAYLETRMQAVAADSARATRAVDGGNVLTTATVYQDRGLSSDTSLLVDYGLDATLAAAARDRLAAGSIRRVAIVGPGLDFVDKQWGYDFYPPQSIQPFAVIDSLLRLGLGTSTNLRVTAFDLGPQVIQHLEAARERAAAGTGYGLTLPRNLDRTWTPGLVEYWQRLGARVGTAVAAKPPPATAGPVQLRSVRVRPAIVRAVTPRDVNVVLEREERPAAEKFDLVIATNILLYYDLFEQSLAVANIASMLKPGGLFLTNTRITLLPGSALRPAGYSDTVYTTGAQGDETGDRIWWFER